MMHGQENIKLPYCIRAGRPQARSYLQQHKPIASHIE